MTQLKTRQEINPSSQWDLTPLIQDEQQWQAYFTDIEGLAQNLQTFAGKLHTSPNTLYDCFKLQETMEEKFSRLHAYTNMKLHEDTSVSKHQAAVETINSLQVTVSLAAAYIEPELLSIDTTQLNDMIDGYPPLKPYRHYIDDLLRKETHILPKEQEELLANLGDFADSPEGIFSMFNNADLKLPDVVDQEGKASPLTKGNFIHYLQNTDVNVRKNAFETLYATYKANENTLAAILSANLKKDVFLMKARNFESTCQGSLFAKNIDVSVYDNLINTVHSHLPLLHRYVALRKKMLRLDTLHMYDLYVPMVSEAKEEIPYEKAKSTVLDALGLMGDHYCATLNKAFDNQWIDVYENVGKRSGAYSWGTYGAHPYILLNWQNNLNDMFTLAHELGHTMHSYYSSATQPFTYANYPIFLAEVASTVNETLLLQHLLSTTTEKKKRMFLLNHYMESFKSTLFRQTLFAEFEKLIHEKAERGEALTSETLGKLYYDLNVAYYGESVVVDEAISMEWARIPHFYSSYYVYQYATGFSAAVAIANDLIHKGQEAVDNYITNFLSVGNRHYPLETLKAVGVDMTSPQPIVNALKVFESVLDEMESLIE